MAKVDYMWWFAISPFNFYKGKRFEKELKCMVSCSLCGKTIEESSILIDEIIEGKHHTFDNEDCVLMFKKLESAYGKEHFLIEC